MENVRNIDVLVIGAGPAGSVCGSLLLQAGIDCLVVDCATFPRDKICGGGLTIKAWRLLDQLLPGIQYDYRPINRMRLQFEDDPVMEFYSAFEIRMTRRKDFDNTLLQYYIQHGGAFQQENFARFDVQPDGRILVTMKSGTRISCRYLIGADGAHSLVRRQLVGDCKANALFLEQFDEGEKSDDIFVHFSYNYAPGSFYKFSSIGRDIYGFYPKTPTTISSAIPRSSARHSISSKFRKDVCVVPTFPWTLPSLPTITSSSSVMPVALPTS